MTAATDRAIQKLDAWRAAQDATDDRRFKYQLIGDVQARIEQAYVAKNIIGANSLAVLYGESGSGKSHVALDIAMNVTQGGTTLGCKTTKGAVIYIAAEGAHGLTNRLAAARERGLIAAGAPLAIVNRAVQMDIETGDPLALIRTMADLATTTGETVQLVVIDTLARCITGDENTAADMGRFVTACDWIRNATTAAVLVVHHAGKDTSKGARGHSSLRAAVDTEILVEGRQNPRTVTITKQRDLPLIDPLGFELDPVTLGTDSDGESVTACTLKLTAAVPVRAEVRGKAQSTLMRALRETERTAPGKVWTIADLRSTGRIAGVHRNSAISAVDSLIAAQLLTPTIGGYRLA